MISFFTALLLFLFVSVVATTFGASLLYYIRFPKEFLYIYAFFLGYAIFGMFIFSYGLFFVYSLSSLFVISLLFFVLSYKEYLPFFVYLHSLIPSSFQNNQKLSSFSTFLIIVLSIFVVANTILTFFPFMEWDAVVYHLPLAQQYATSGSTAPLPFVFHAQFPQLIDVLFSIGYLFNFEVGDAFVSFFLLTFHHLFFIFLYLFARRFYGHFVALLTVVFLYTMPEMSIYLTNPYIDIIVLGYSFLAFSCLFIPLFDSSLRKHTNAFIIVAFLLAGATAAMKYTGLFVVFFVFLLALLLLYIQHLHYSKFAYLVLGSSLLLSSLFFMPMYLKNYFFTGNPFWPFLFDLFPQSVGLTSDLVLAWNDYFVNLTFDKSSPLSFLFLPFFMTFKQSSFGSLYGIGPIFVMFIPLAILFVLFRKRFAFSLSKSKHIVFYLLCSLFFLFIWYKTQHSFRLYFFGLTLWMLVSILAFEHFISFVDSVFRDRLRVWVRSFVFLLLIGVVIANVVAYCAIYRAVIPATISSFTGEEGFDFNNGLDVYRAGRMQIAPVDLYIKSTLPPDAIILLPNDLRSHYMQRAFVWGEPMNNMMYIDYASMDDVTDLVYRLDELGVTHIRITLFAQYGYTYGFYDKYYGEKITALYDELFANHVILLYEENNVLLYALK